MNNLDQMPVKRSIWRGDVTSLAGKAYKALEEKIVMLELAPGEIYTEKDLAIIVGLGRTPVRDALLRLEHDQLLSVIPRQGIMILPLDFERDLLALDLRAVVERIVVERATRLATLIERKRLARMADEMEKAAEDKDVLAFTRLDDAFHDFIANCAQQPFAAKTLEPLHSLSRRAGTILFRQDFEREIVEASHTHYVLMRAIADGDLERADAAFDGLIERARRVTLELAESQSF
ncbi:GntR family transcriptional regulator [Shumkonia mesophila]|uniref:GntR family transcriptional regulator n=1 Tax=Shumkonia mesophila TaxID=2838854 RepID=UPI002934100B|nr:GntR family transcriptional regulator [Shumkonia mesophila]